MHIFNSCKNSIPKREPNHLAAGGYIREAITKENWIHELDSAQVTFFDDNWWPDMTRSWKPLAKLVSAVALLNEQELLEVAQ